VRWSASRRYSRVMDSVSAPRPAPAIVTAARVLRVDSVTAEVVTAMRRAGIRPLLLKGPSTAAWLYGDGAARPYGDTDLLVAPKAYRPAGDVLRGLGFRSRAYAWEPDSQAWLRRADASLVDLHCTLIGAFAPRDKVWKELAAHTDTLRVGGIDVEVPRIPARALHIALHAAQHGDDYQQPSEDLGRAIRLANEKTWREAADVARRIDAVPAFAAGLRLNPDGVRVAERLELPSGPPPAVLLRPKTRAPVAFALDVLTDEKQRRARARLLVRSIFPSPLYMRQWSAMHMTRWPAAFRRGSAGLMVAYLWRPVWVLLRLPKAIMTLRGARRAQARDRG